MSEKYVSEFEKTEEIKRKEELEKKDNFSKNRDPLPGKKVNIVPAWIFYITTIVISSLVGIYIGNKELANIAEGDPQLAEVEALLGQGMGTIKIIGIFFAVIAGVIAIGIVYFLLKFLIRFIWDVELKQGVLIQAILVSNTIQGLATLPVAFLNITYGQLLNIMGSIIAILIFYFMVKKYEGSEKAKFSTIGKLLLTILSIILSMVMTTFFVLPGI